MKENVDKRLDQLSRKVIGKSTLEKPSFDFTANVMSQIERLSNARVFIYKPLISRWVWLFLGVLVTAIFTYVLFFSSENDGGTIQSLIMKDSTMENIGKSLQGFKVSEISVYAVLLFCAMLYVQIPIIKAYRKRGD